MKKLFCLILLSLSIGANSRFTRSAKYPKFLYNFDSVSQSVAEASCKAINTRLIGISNQGMNRQIVYVITNELPGWNAAETRIWTSDEVTGDQTKASLPKEVTKFVDLPSDVTNWWEFSLKLADNYSSQRKCVAIYDKEGRYNGNLTVMWEIQDCNTKSRFICEDVCYGISCGLHGSCKAAEISPDYKCSCQLPYFGEKCTKEYCQNSNPCTSNKLCESSTSEPGYVCSCPSGYFDIFGGTCIDQIIVIVVIIGGVLVLIFLIVMAACASRKRRATTKSGRGMSQRELVHGRTVLQSTPVHTNTPSNIRETSGTSIKDGNYIDLGHNIPAIVVNGNHHHMRVGVAKPLPSTNGSTHLQLPLPTLPDQPASMIEEISSQYPRENRQETPQRAAPSEMVMRQTNTVVGNREHPYELIRQRPIAPINSDVVATTPSSSSGVRDSNHPPKVVKKTAQMSRGKERADEVYGYVKANDVTFLANGDVDDSYEITRHRPSSVFSTDAESTHAIIGITQFFEEENEYLQPNAIESTGVSQTQLTENTTDENGYLKPNPNISQMYGPDNYPYEVIKNTESTGASSTQLTEPTDGQLGYVAPNPVIFHENGEIDDTYEITSNRVNSAIYSDVESTSSFSTWDLDDQEDVPTSLEKVEIAEDEDGYLKENQTSSQTDGEGDYDVVENAESTSTAITATHSTEHMDEENRYLITNEVIFQADERMDHFYEIIRRQSNSAFYTDVNEAISSLQSQHTDNTTNASAEHAAKVHYDEVPQVTEDDQEYLQENKLCQQMERERNRRYEVIRNTPNTPWPSPPRGTGPKCTYDENGARVTGQRISPQTVEEPDDAYEVARSRSVSSRTSSNHPDEDHLELNQIASQAEEDIEST